jgi:hypothetical protein
VVEVSAQPPADLSADSAAWFRSVVEGWKLEAHHLHLLALAARALDRCEQAREAIARDGAYFKDARGNPRPHPALRIEVESRRQYASLLRELNLDEQPAPAAPRKPTRWRS